MLQFLTVCDRIYADHRIFTIEIKKLNMLARPLIIFIFFYSLSLIPLYGEEVSQQYETVVLEDGLVAELHTVIKVTLYDDEWESEEWVHLDDGSVWDVRWYEGGFYKGQEVGVLYLKPEQIDPNRPFVHWLIRWSSSDGHEIRTPFIQYFKNRYRAL